MTAETLDDDISALPQGTESSASDARREQLLSFIQTHEFVRIYDLARQFSVSEVTIRSDVDILARRGGIRRVRGGAMRVVEAVPEVDYEARVSSYLPEKRLIGQAAAAMLSSGDSLILDVGTTAMAIAHAIADREDLINLTIFTPGLNIALALERAIPRVEVIVTGGTLRPQQHSLVGPVSTLILERIRASFAFIGCNGVDPSFGIMGLSLPDAALKQAILKASRLGIVVTDASKFTQTSLVRVCGFEDVDMIMTAGAPDPSAVAAVRESGVELRILN
ncbi:DeoR/GlpR family DNA-binding transcription regulator [Dongia rigui]|uniref:DeoR/GlpR family DNA-binding transcription regulator n=1 Tax=Dongia rigui TaxID=940149 RepID=A0ABU5E479_9PROT|nr:DeoR/GlpR family DNA-binding transcription regulator [Dongia rigui]MDY0874409.1 DeoR/GlpR family DNA-binding transcription regulator [Dongia rigui]